MHRVEREGPEVLEAVQDEIRRNPEAGRVIPGTGGLRKIRVERAGKGKRGGYRVIYLGLGPYGRVHLLDIYAKGEKEDISPEEKAILTRVAALLWREVE